MHCSAQDGRIRQGLDHDQRPLAGGDGDAVRAFGVLVADAQRIPYREDGICQLIVGAALTDALSPALQWEDGNVEELRLRVGTLLAARTKVMRLRSSCSVARTPRCSNPRPVQRFARVCSSRLPPRAPSSSTSEQPFSEASFAAYSVSVSSLTWGRDDDVILLLRAGRGVEVADDNVRFAAQRRTVAVARVAGNDDVIGPQQALQLRRDRASRYDHTA